MTGPRVIHVAHSPDSDDAFMFYALATGRVDTEGLQYVHELQDIETLNQRARRGELEVTAVSIHAYAHLTDRYALLPHGASMGDRYGPRLVARAAVSVDQLAGKRIAIPGLLTSAYLALRLRLPEFVPVVTPFDEIERAVLSGTVDAGLIIHEGQLTYADSGLHLVLDLGEWWFGETGLPLPLGGNVIRKDLGAPAYRQDLPPPAREHRARARAPCRSPRSRDAVRARAGAPPRGHVRGHVRQRLDPRLRRARPGRDSHLPRAGCGGWVDPPRGRGRVRRRLGGAPVARAREVLRSPVFVHPERCGAEAYPLPSDCSREDPH